MKNDKKELLAGSLLFLFAVGAFLFIGSRRGMDGKSADSYLLSVRFNQADGLSVGNDVRLAGIRVGKVVGERLDDHYGVVVTFSLPNKVLLPDDSGASIQSDGLFGSKFIELAPGGSEDFLADGDTLSFSEDALNLERLLDKVIAMAKADRAKRRCP